MSTNLQPSPVSYCGYLTPVRSIRAGIEAELSRMTPSDRRCIAATVRSASAPLTNLVRASSASRTVQIAAAVDGRFLVAAPELSIEGFVGGLCLKGADMARHGFWPGQGATDLAMGALKHRLRRGAQGDGSTGGALHATAALVLASRGHSMRLERRAYPRLRGLAFLLALENDNAAMFAFVVEAP